MSDTTSSSFLVGETSRWTAGVRAQESLREDRLFNDPWAAALAGVEGQHWAENGVSDNGVSIVVRTRFFDDFLQGVTRENGVRQVVLMAAGLDTRAFRLAWPEQTRLFEMDQPQVLEKKEEVLQAAGVQPACERHILKVDLTGPWSEALRESGFDAQKPAVWLLEGFVFYIPNESITRLLDEITHLSVPESWLGFDVVNQAMLTSRWTKQWAETLARRGIPWIGTMDDPKGFLRKRGWLATLTQAGEKEASYGRWPYPVIPRLIPGMPRDWFVTALKK